MNLLKKVGELLRPKTGSAAKQKDASAATRKQRGIAFVGGLMEVRSIDFFGPYAMSPSKQWALGWRDADISAGRGGHRDKGHGSYVLYDVAHDRVAVVGKLERPNRGAVADNGIFILQDWHFGEGLQGTLFVFASNGSILYKRRFDANLFNGALSADSVWAICQTANNPDHTDGNRLTAFDLRQSREMFSVSPQTGWADDYEFSAEGSRFIVVHNDLGKFAYDGSGNFLEGEAYENACLSSKRFEISLFAARTVALHYPRNGLISQRLRTYAPNVGRLRKPSR